MLLTRSEAVHTVFAAAYLMDVGSRFIIVTYSSGTDFTSCKVMAHSLSASWTDEPVHCEHKYVPKC